MKVENFTIYFTTTIYFTFKENGETKHDKHTCRNDIELIDFINWLIKNKYTIFKIEYKTK